MREIKFRLWDIKNNTIREPETLEQMVMEGGVLNLGIWYEVMQFTGVKDKTGKDIYEGDILEWPWEDKKGIEHAVVEWDDEWRGWVLLRNLTVWEKDFIQTSVKVIGNIYENPDLG